MKHLRSYLRALSTSIISDSSWQPKQGERGWHLFVRAHVDHYAHYDCSYKGIRLRIKNSPIEGARLGLFANEDIPPGTKLCDTDKYPFGKYDYIKKQHATIYTEADPTINRGQLYKLLRTENEYAHGHTDYLYAPDQTEVGTDRTEYQDPYDYPLGFINGFQPDDPNYDNINLKGEDHNGQLVLTTTTSVESGNELLWKYEWATNSSSYSDASSGSNSSSDSNSSYSNSSSDSNSSYSNSSSDSNSSYSNSSSDSNSSYSNSSSDSSY